jgi:hypothetical protein
MTHEQAQKLTLMPAQTRYDGSSLLLIACDWLGAQHMPMHATCVCSSPILPLPVKHRIATTAIATKQAPVLGALGDTPLPAGRRGW